MIVLRPTFRIPSRPDAISLLIVVSETDTARAAAFTSKARGTSPDPFSQPSHGRLIVLLARGRLCFERAGRLVLFVMCVRQLIPDPITVKHHK